MSNKAEINLRDQLRALVSDLLHDSKGTWTPTAKRAQALGVVFPWDIGKDVEQLRLLVGRIMNELYPISHTIIEARALEIVVKDPNPHLDRIREAEKELELASDRYRETFLRSGLQIGKIYRLTNDDRLRIDDARFDPLGCRLRCFNLDLNYRTDVYLPDLLERVQRDDRGNPKIVPAC